MITSESEHIGFYEVKGEIVVRKIEWPVIIILQCYLHNLYGVIYRNTLILNRMWSSISVDPLVQLVFGEDNEYPI